MKLFNKEGVSGFVSAIGDTLLIALLTTLPTIFGGAKILFDNDLSSFSGLYISGEFFLYGVSFLGSSYLVYNHFKPKQGYWTGFFRTIVLILIFLFSIAYTAIPNSVNPNYALIEKLSFVAIFISVAFLFYSQVLNNKKSIDVGDVRREEQVTIENALN